MEDNHKSGSSISQLLRLLNTAIDDSMAEARRMTFNMNEVKSLQSEVLKSFNRMKALVNELGPINRLPPEVLSVIPKYWPADAQGDLIRATHVCRYWRTTLIASPSLWNVVKSDNEARMEAYIHRSQPYPLTVEIKHPGQEGVLSDAVLFRLKSLTLNLPTVNLARPVGRLISPTPMLEELSITLAGFRGYLPALQMGDFFMLSKLHLDGVHANIAHLFIPNLTTLHLENLQNNPHMSDLLQFLERTPWLERLVLVNAGPDGDNEPRERVVGLGSIRVLTLHGTVAKAKLLQHLAIPASADIDLIGRFNQRLGGVMEEFLPPCLDNLPIASTFTSLTITSTSRPSCSCNMEFSGNGGKLRVTVKNENHRWIFGESTTSTANLCLQHLTPLVLDTVTHLILQRDPRGRQNFPEIPAFREFLQQFPSLRSIGLVRCDFSSIRALDPVAVNLPFFRALNIYVDTTAKLDIGLLAHIAESRSVLQCPLERVRLVCGFATRVMFMGSGMDRLREHVQVVEVEEVDENNTNTHHPSDAS